MTKTRTRQETRLDRTPAFVTAQACHSLGSGKRRAWFGLMEAPMGYVDGMSVYEYVKSAPVMYQDPQGTGAFNTKPGSGDRPHFVPGDRSNLPPIAFVQWAVDIPKGIAHYSFRWQTRDATTLQDITALSEVRNVPRKRPDTEQPGDVAYYFFIDGPRPFWLANFAVGATGLQNPKGAQDPGWFDRNNGKTTSGWAEFSLEVRDVQCIEGETLQKLFGEYGGEYLNNANRLYYGGGILDIPLAGKGMSMPEGWSEAKTVFKAWAFVTWNQGNYVLQWRFNDTGGDETGAY